MAWATWPQSPGGKLRPPLWEDFFFDNTSLNGIQRRWRCTPVLFPRIYILLLFFQDAQEFSKLFMSLLEDTLSSQKNPDVRDIVQKQFCGEYAYVTV